MKKKKNSNADLEELTSQLARKEETGQKSQIGLPDVHLKAQFQSPGPVGLDKDTCKAQAQDIVYTRASKPLRN